MSFSMMKWFEWQESPCIEYNGTAYPQLVMDGRGVRISNIVMAYLKPLEPPGWIVVCHKCDNPLCVNPDHLYYGTPGDNQRDTWLKGIPPQLRPEHEIHPSARKHILSYFGESA